MNLKQATEAAKRISREAQENCYILDAPVYVDEFDEGNYVVGTVAVCATMFRPIPKHPELCRVVGVIGPTDERPFFNDPEIVVGELQAALSMASAQL